MAIRLTAVMLLTGALSGRLLAQAGGSAATAPLTLNQAIEEATTNNLGLLAERYNLSIAAARLLQARLRPNPVFTMGADYQDLLQRGFTVENSAGPPELNWRTDFLIEGGRKRERRIEVAQGVRSVAELQLLDSLRRLTLDVQSAFIEVLAAKENVSLAQNNLDALRGIVRVNTERVRTGDLANVELSRSRIAELQFENAVRQAQLRLVTASNHMQLLLGRKALSPSFDVSGDFRRETAPMIAAEIRGDALRLRPDLQALKRDQARSDSEVRLQLAQGKIDYTLGAMYHHQYSYSNGRAFGFYLSVPLPVFNRNQGEIERARQEQRQIETRIRALALEVSSEVENAWQQYSTAKALLQNIEANMLQQAREVRQTTEYSYRRGEASLVEFLDAQRAFNDTVQSYNEARADYARSLYLLESVSGRSVQ